METVIEKLTEAGMSEFEACLLIAQLLEEEAEDYLELKDSDLKITSEDIENLKDLLLTSTHKFS